MCKAYENARLATVSGASLMPHELLYNGEVVRL